MKLILFIFLTTLFFVVNAQKISGKYCLKKANILTESYSVFEIEIENDSSYKSSYFSSSDSNFKNYKNWNVEKKQGKIRKKTANNYFFIDTDSVTNKSSESFVKITKRKIIFYGYKKAGDKRLVKGFEMTACL